MRPNRPWLLALCVVGMGALLILPSLGISIGSLFGFLLILLCPLSHLLMMRGWHGGHKGTNHTFELGERTRQSKGDSPAPADRVELSDVRKSEGRG